MAPCPTVRDRGARRASIRAVGSSRTAATRSFAHSAVDTSLEHVASLSRRRVHHRSHACCVHRARRSRDVTGSVAGRPKSPVPPTSTHRRSSERRTGQRVCRSQGVATRGARRFRRRRRARHRRLERVRWIPCSRRAPFRQRTLSIPRTPTGRNHHVRLIDDRPCRRHRPDRGPRARRLCRRIRLGRRDLVAPGRRGRCGGSAQPAPRALGGFGLHRQCRQPGRWSGRADGPLLRRCGDHQRRIAGRQRRRVGVRRRVPPR